MSYLSHSIFPYRRLSDVTINHDRRRIPVTKDDREAGPYPYYGASGIVDCVAGYIYDGTHLLVSEDGDNLRSRTTPVAFLASGKFWVNNHAHVVTGNGVADTRYLCHALQVIDISGYLSGSTRPKLTRRDLDRIEVPVPPIEEQRRIAAVLGALDDKIELNRQMNQTLEEMAQALFKSWFIDFDGHEDLVDSELGPIPRGWTVRPLADCTSHLRRGLSPSYTDVDGIPVINQKCIRGSRVDIGQARLHDLIKRPVDGRLLQSGDILVNSTGVGTLGRIAQLPDFETPLVCDSHVTVVRAAKEVNALFLGAYLMHLQPVVEGLGQGSTGQTELSRDVLGRLLIAVPPAATQESFANKVEPFRSKMFLNEKESRTLAELRDLLLPKLISGELRVPESLDLPP